MKIQRLKDIQAIISILIFVLFLVGIITRIYPENFDFAFFLFFLVAVDFMLNLFIKKQAKKNTMHSEP